MKNIAQHFGSTSLEPNDIAIYSVGVGVGVADDVQLVS